MADPCRSRGQVPVVVRMPVELHEALKAAARLDGRPVAQAIRSAISSYVAQVNPHNDARGGDR